MLHHHHNSAYLATLAAEGRRCGAGRSVEHVVAAAQHGDQSAWSALVTRVRRRILSVARVHGLGTHQAEDVAQETCVRLYRSLASLRDPRALDAWVLTTARRESLRALRGASRELPTEEELGHDALPLEDDPVSDERRGALAQAFTDLPPIQRRLMEMLISDPAPSYAEVSARLGIPVGSIGPTRGRAVERLRDALVNQD